MKVTVDTNVLVRAAVKDDSSQAQTAARILREAELIAVSTVVLCELAWVLRSAYGFTSQEISRSLSLLLNAANVEVNRSAVEAGQRTLEEGGDFADGIIDFEGAWLGGETFLSFDKKAVKRITSMGRPARLLS